ncbi:uncharacterized protein IL334_003009 [Kwoniella shivajii]|uniref:B30.2/SPRY domain-containing protein n=1 Tax=Kwoniella shivajii TaxID=564305 RepID=A0ABZ1D0G8_9TREE|nr:hypothetical protein IL334_003009 [Kwoniella shivajii]
MPVKKRRLSPSASSASSAPAPASQISSSHLDAPTLSNFPSTSTQGLAGPGPSTLSHQYQSRQERNDAAERRSFARTGAQVPGSGDGPEHGEECYLWVDVPIVKNFRYAPCAISPIPSPHPKFPFHRTIPYPLPIPPVHISWLDRSSYLRISPDASTISNDRGFRSARANVAVREGTWYFEVKIERGSGPAGGGKGHLTSGDSGNAHVRIGWGRREASVDAPVGADGYSYAIRDVGGDKVTLARPKPYGESFQSGDVIGCLISLPTRPSSDNLPREDPGKTKRQRRHFLYKNQSYFESAEYMPAKEMEALVDREGKLAAAQKAAEAVVINGITDSDISNGIGVSAKTKKGATTKNTKKQKDEASQHYVPLERALRTLKGSRIEFFKNGKPFGIAFENLYDFPPLPPLYHSSLHEKRSQDDEIMHDDGTMGYFPMVSCFGKGKARFNPGPQFAFPPSGYQTTRIDEKLAEVPMVGIQQNIRPICERWEEFRQEEMRYDEKDEAEGTERLKEILEEEEKARVRAALAGGVAKKKRGLGKKKKVEVTESHGAGFASRGGTLTPAPEEANRVAPDPEYPSVKDEAEARSASVARTIPPTRDSSPASTKFYSETDKQTADVVEDTPKSPGSVDHHLKDEKYVEVDAQSLLVDGNEHTPHESGEDEEEGVEW